MSNPQIVLRTLFPAVMIGLYLSIPALAAEPAADLTYSAKQLPPWADEAWSDYRAKWSSGQFSDAEEILSELRKRAIGMGIQRFDLPAAVMIREGEEALSEGRTEDGIRYGKAATEWSPGDPNSWFFLSKALHAQSPFKPFPALTNYIKGVSVGLSDFWFAFYLIGRVALIVAFGLLASFLVFFALVLIRYVPFLVHGLHERFSNYLNVPAVWTVVISVILMPLFVGLGPGFVFLIGLGLVWLYMTWNERIVTSLFLVAVGLSGIWLPVALSFYTADQSEQLVLMSRVLRGDAAVAESARRVVGGGEYKERWPVLFSLALQARRDENYAEALDRYEAVQKLEPDRYGILNNMANIYVLTNDYDKAQSLYKQAILKAPGDAVSHYNLSLVYRELLLFDDAENEYNAAQQISLPLIQSFQGMGSIDELFPSSTLWTAAFSDTPLRRQYAEALYHKILSPLTLGGSLAVLVVTGGLALLIRLAIPHKFLGGSCALCGRSICVHCQRRLLDIKICNPCWQESKNIRRKGDLRQLKWRQRWNHRVAGLLSLLLPGAGHIYLGKVARGFAFLAIFMGVLYLVFFPSAFLKIPGETNAFGWVGTLVVILVLVLLYSRTILDIHRQAPERY
jgi:TM2 domain-containing membrane protein YozV